jgi:hypothetical protein
MPEVRGQDGLEKMAMYLTKKKTLHRVAGMVVVYRHLPFRTIELCRKQAYPED